MAVPLESAAEPPSPWRDNGQRGFAQARGPTQHLVGTPPLCPRASAPPELSLTPRLTLKLGQTVGAAPTRQPARRVVSTGPGSRAPRRWLTSAIPGRLAGRAHHTARDARIVGGQRSPRHRPPGVPASAGPAGLGHLLRHAPGVPARPGSIGLYGRAAAIDLVLELVTIPAHPAAAAGTGQEPFFVAMARGARPV